MAAESTYYSPPYAPYNKTSHRPLRPSSVASTSYNSNSDHTTSRKRSRADTLDATASLYTSSSRWTDQEDLGNSIDSIGPASPPPLSNATYRLAGGLDTPTKESTRQFESIDYHSEGDYRRRWASSTRDVDDGRQTIIFGALERESNGRPRGAVINPTEHESWGHLVASTVVGVVGKMWNFCKAGAFQGFTAGARDLTDSGLRRSSSSASQSARHKNSKRDVNSNSIPGQFPVDEDDCYEVHEESRPAKRLRSEDDWVIVNPPHPSSISRSISVYSESASRRSQASRRSIRATPVSRPKSSITRQSSASYASGSPRASASGHTRSASVATARFPATTPQAKRSPAAAIFEEDIQRYSAKKKREVKQSDASMRRLNDQLQMMIQQGKDALNSTVEVEIEEAFDPGVFRHAEYEDEETGDGESDFEWQGRAR